MLGQASNVVGVGVCMELACVDPRACATAFGYRQWLDY